MALLIALMALGVVAGYLLRRHARVQRIASIATTVAVYGLLLSLGIALGSSGEVRTALPTLGGAGPRHRSSHSGWERAPSLAAGSTLWAVV